jgi:protocatechuate 3,4-dioxygenase beta subunit
MKGKLLIALLGLTLLAVFPGLSFAQFGSVSGRVTDGTTGDPIAGAAVTLSGIWGFWHTNSEGYYACDSVPAGAYIATAYAGGYFAEAYPESVIVIEGQNTPNIDFALTPTGEGTGSISGTVTDEVTGDPIPGARVTAVGLDNWCFGESFTDSAGYYVVENLCAGLWEVRTEALGYIAEVYPESVIVIGGENTPNIDFALTPHGGGEVGSISGRVTDEQTGLPIVMAQITITGIYHVWHTDTSGLYFCDNLPPGSYEVHAGKYGYIPETYPDSVTVVAGENTPDIDFALTPHGGPEFGSISGQVIDEETGLPLIMARLRAIGLDNPCHGAAWSDTGGWYAVLDLCPGTYQVIASYEGYAPEVYPEPVVVVAGETTPGIDFALSPIGECGSISGMVTDEVTGLPISMAHLIAIGLDNWCFAQAWSQPGGHYTIPHLCPGVYQVNVHAQGYIPETYPDSVTVIAGENTPGIDFALVPEGGPQFGSIAGRVTDEETGLPIITAEITITGIYGVWLTDTAGYYFCGNLPPDSYEVHARKCSYVPETYPELVTVTAGETTAGIDFALTPIGDPGSISGTVTDADTGEPIPDARVWACGEFGHGCALTNSSGEYTISGLYAGDYFVSAWAWGYHPADYPTVVTVEEGQDTPGVDFALVPYGGPGEGVIAGDVLDDSTLLPIPFAIVFAVSWNGNWGFDLADSVGTYVIEGLQTDDYYVLAIAPGYIGEFYDGVYSWHQATLVTPDAYDIDFYLGTCGAYDGRVSGAISSEGSPVEGALVYAEANGEVKGFARSSTDGGYVMNGLDAGTYTVYASQVSYHDGAYPDPVQVGYGKVSDINIELPPVQVGDVNGDGSIEAGDVVFLINYLYLDGAAPDPVMTGDTNGDGTIGGGDIVYLINYLFRGGPAPCGP